MQNGKKWIYDKWSFRTTFKKTVNIGNIVLMYLMLPKGLYKDSLNIWGLFRDVKTEKMTFGKTPKNERHKMGANFSPQLYFVFNFFLYIIKKLNCVLSYSKIEIFQKCMI